MITAREIQRFEINGIKVLYVKNESYLTSIQLLTGVGSGAEEPEIQGMAHILEHMFFKGTEKRPGGTAIARAANDIGGKMNAYTTYDHTNYYITVLNDKFAEGLDLLADMYQNATFPADEFEKELNPILSELREREDDPDNYLMERTLQQYMGQSYHPVIGHIETVKSATVEKMHTFKKRFYGGNNLLVSIVGGVDEATVRKLLSECFAETAPTEAPVETPVTYTPGELNLTRAAIQEAYYYQFFPALPQGHPDRFKQDVMTYILGGNDSALLFERIREDLGMSCYGVYSWVWRYQPFSLVGIACGIAPDELDQLDQEVNDQIKRICDSPVPEDMLTRARASLRTGIAAKAETSGGLGGLISVPILRGETENPLTVTLREIENVTREDILEHAQKTFAAKPFKSVLLPET